jgi:hypothetical protein
MFNFITKYLAVKKGKKEYEAKLTQALQDGTISSGESQDLKETLDHYGLGKKELLAIQQKAFALTFGQTISDKKISEEEKKALEALVNYFGLSLDEIRFDQRAFNKYYTLGLLDKGIFPQMESDGTGIILKKEEKVHWLCAAQTLRHKSVTQRINYGGLTGSVRIAKGLRYRVGSLNVSRVTSDVLTVEDTGLLWITNKRIGFKGAKKDFAIAYEKVLSFDVSSAGMVIAKEGRDTPYIIAPDDFDVPCAVLSALINQE